MKRTLKNTVFRLNENRKRKRRAKEEGKRREAKKNRSVIQVQILLDEYSKAFISRQNPGNLLQLQWQ